MLMINYQTDESVVNSVLEREFTESKIKEVLEKYLEVYETEYNNITHKEYVKMYVTGLLSNIERKSIEPIALNLKGPEAVRGFPNFFSRSTFNTNSFLKKYQAW